MSSFAAKVDGAKREKEQKKKGSGAGHPEALAPQPQEEKMKKKKKQKKRSSGTGHTQAPAQQPQEEPKKPSLANHPGLAGVQRKWEEKEKRDAGERYLAITRATSSASSEDDEDDEDDDEDIPARPPSRRDQSFAIENYDEGNDQDVEEDKDTPEIGGFVVSDGQPLVLDDLPVKDDVNDEDYRDNDGDDDDDDQSTDTDSSVSSHGKADEMTEPLSNSVDLGKKHLAYQIRFISSSHCTASPTHIEWDRMCHFIQSSFTPSLPSRHPPLTTGQVVDAQVTFPSHPMRILLNVRQLIWKNRRNRQPNVILLELWIGKRTTNAA